MFPSFEEFQSLNAAEAGEDAIASLFGTLPPLRGISTYFVALAKALARKAPVEIVAFDQVAPGILYPGASARVGWTEDVQINARVRRTNPFNPLFWYRTIRDTASRILHFQWWNPFLSPAIVAMTILGRIRGHTIVLTLHNLRANEFGAWDSILLRVALGLAHAVIVHHEEGLKDVGPRHTLTRFIRPGTLGNPKLRRDDARARLRIGDGIKVVLFFGNIRPYKGLDVLLSALGRLDNRDDVNLIVAGDSWGRWEEPYGTLVKSLGPKVRMFVGYHPPDFVDRLFSAADIVVLPYRRFSAQSAVGLMALRYGCPMLVTSVGGLPDLVQDQRAICPPGDVRRLVRNLKRVLDDPTLLAKLREDSRTRAAVFDWGQAADAYLQVYRELVPSARF